MELEGVVGLQPTTFSVEARRSKRLSYTPIKSGIAIGVRTRTTSVKGKCVNRYTMATTVYKLITIL